MTLKVSDLKAARYIISQNYDPKDIKVDGKRWTFVFAGGAKRHFDAYYNGNDVPVKASVLDTIENNLKKRAYQS